MNWIDYKKQNLMDFLPHVKDIIDTEKLKVPNKKRHIVHQRFFLMWFLRENTSMTLTDIANLFDRDHATVIHGVKYHNNSIEIKDLLYFRNVEGIKFYLETIQKND